MRLFVLLENACHELDLMAHTQRVEDFGPSYRRYANALQELTQCKDEKLALTTSSQRIEQLVTHALVTGELTASDSTYLDATACIQSTKARIQQLVSGEDWWLT